MSRQDEQYNIGGNANCGNDQYDPSRQQGAHIGDAIGADPYAQGQYTRRYTGQSGLISDHARSIAGTFEPDTKVDELLHSALYTPRPNPRASDNGLTLTPEQRAMNAIYEQISGELRGRFNCITSLRKELGMSEHYTAERNSVIERLVRKAEAQERVLLDISELLVPGGDFEPETLADRISCRLLELSCGENVLVGGASGVGAADSGSFASGSGTQYAYVAASATRNDLTNTGSVVVQPVAEGTDNDDA